MKTIDCLRVLQALPEGFVIAGYRLRKWGADDHDFFEQPVPVSQEIQRLSREKADAEWRLDLEEGGKVTGFSVDFAEKTLLLHLDVTIEDEAASPHRGPHLSPEGRFARPARP